MKPKSFKRGDRVLRLRFVTETEDSYRVLGTVCSQTPNTVRVLIDGDEKPKNWEKVSWRKV